MDNKTIQIELLAALKTIQKNGLEADYVADKIALLENLLIDRGEESDSEESYFKEYKGDVFLYTDGGSRGNPGPSGCGCVIEVGDYVVKANHFLGHATNNEAEYCGVILGIKKMAELGLTGVNAYFRSDSQLAMKQLSGEWRIKEPRMKAYADEVAELLEKHNIRASFTFVPRERNKEADVLTNAAMDGKKINEISKS